MTQQNSNPALPPVLAGPLLRRVETQRVVLWLATTRPLELELHLRWPSHEERLPLNDLRCQRIPVGQRAWLHLIDVTPELPFPTDTLLEYNLHVLTPTGKQGVADYSPHLLHEGQTMLTFVRRERVDHVLHGSCRKPHYPCADGLQQADRLIQQCATPLERPAFLMLSGDQIYADDVAGPMLAAIHALIETLGLFEEQLEGAAVADSPSLYKHPYSYYQRESLLPACKANDTLRERFFGGTAKPVFTSSNAHNHLVTFAEVLAMYLLVWSPTPWQLIESRCPTLSDEQRTRYAEETIAIEAFRETLPLAARALAHLPVFMIFDDHDITDDWNLSAQWEESAYGHPFSRRIVGNALLGYLLCQSWGNNPDDFRAVLPDLIDACNSAAYLNNRLSASVQDALISRLLAFKQWGYRLPTTPCVIVLDTRTRRWRSETDLSHPSGLMDWEALCELQEQLIDQPSAIIVSPAPMFGVKLIEVIQHLFTLAGQPLMVDAENWMAHPGSAMVMLSIFSHSRTPANYVILSGDVHYSFAYEVHIRHGKNSPHLWQITSSGIKNEFPYTLLTWFDRLNRWLYSPRSPLNWFTRRRHLAIAPYLPNRRERGERLWNQSGLGQVLLDSQGQPHTILQHNADGSPPVRFIAPNR